MFTSFASSTESRARWDSPDTPPDTSNPDVDTVYLFDPWIGEFDVSAPFERHHPTAVQHGPRPLSFNGQGADQPAGPPKLPMGAAPTRWVRHKVGFSAATRTRNFPSPPEPKPD